MTPDSTWVSTQWGVYPGSSEQIGVYDLKRNGLSFGSLLDNVIIAMINGIIRTFKNELWPFFANLQACERSGLLRSCVSHLETPPAS